MDNEKLKTCPFCGSDNLQIDTVLASTYTSEEGLGSLKMKKVVCKDCGSSGSFTKNIIDGDIAFWENKAIEAWNRREPFHVPKYELQDPLEGKYGGLEAGTETKIEFKPIDDNSYDGKFAIGIDPYELGTLYSLDANKIVDAYHPPTTKWTRTPESGVPEFTLSKTAMKVFPWCWCKNGEDGESFLGMFTGSGNWTDNTGKKTDVTHYIVIEKP